MRKNAQLQIRLTSEEKRRIRQAAKRRGLEISEWVLGRALSADRERFEEVAEALAGSSDPSFVLAELHDFLAGLNRSEFRQALYEPPPGHRSPYLDNTMAAMIEWTASSLGIPPPAWTQTIKPLSSPVFATSLKSLRLYLLSNSPVPFRRRNLFVDQTVGARI